jgi:hypothetical protein
MRIDPVNNEVEDPYRDLLPLDKVMRKIAIAVAFVGVFIWFFKVIFG